MCNRYPRTPEEDPWVAHGGYMGAKMQKLQNQYSEENVELRRVSNIFKGVCIFVNGYTEPSFDVLRQIMLDHGGTFEHYSCSRVTHVIAVNLPQSKQHEMESKAFVHPNWLVDCVTAGKLLSCAPYKLTTSHYSRLQKMESLLLSSTLDNCDCSTMTTVTKDLHRPAEVRYGKMATESTERPALPCHPVPVAKTIENTEQPKTAMASAHEPRFIADFYSNSRLHHISTLGLEFRELVQRLAASRAEFPGLERLKIQFGLRIQPPSLPSSDVLPLPMSCEKCFLHIDMDCFFVSVGLRHRPDLIGKPVAVSHSRMGTKAEGDLGDCKRKRHGHNNSEVKLGGAETHVTADVTACIESLEDGRNGLVHRQKTRQSMAEIASCNYEARKAGVRNGMLLGRAVKLCPELVVIPYDFKSYSKVATLMYETVASYTVLMQAVSCDEVYVDCSTIVKEIDINPEQLAAALRKDIYDTTQCTASVGIGPNMLVARLANKKAKPNGIYHVLKSQVADFMTAQYVSDIPGVGYSLENRLSKLNVVTCGDLQRLTKDDLQAEFGEKTGRRLYMFARGDDDGQLKVAQKRQSVSAEINYGIRLNKNAEVVSFLRGLSTEVCARLEKAGVMGSRLTLKVKVRRKDAPTKTLKYMGHGICDTMSKACQLRSPTDDVDVISTECCRMYSAMGIAPCDLRGVGIVMQRLANSGDTVDPACRATLGVLTDTVALRTERACEGTSDNRIMNLEKMPTFCGYTDVEDVKIVMKEWINKSCSGPHMHDESMVVKFLVDLIDTKNMDASFYLTSYLFQQITKLLNEEWAQCYCRIWDCVQARVNEQYGGIFKLPRGHASFCEPVALKSGSRLC